MAAAVMGDAAVSADAQKHHLVFPGVRAQRPPVTEDHGLSRAPVLVVDLRAVFGSDRGHCLSPWLIGGSSVSHVRPPLPLGRVARLQDHWGSSTSTLRAEIGCAQSPLYSVVLPSKCSLSASASARVWWMTPSR